MINAIYQTYGNCDDCRNETTLNGLGLCDACELYRGLPDEEKYGDE